MDEAGKVLIEEITRLSGETQALKELYAALLAETALTQPDPPNYIEGVIKSEEGAVYAAAVHDEAPTPTVLKIRQYKAAFRNSAFELARQALRRMIATRRS